MTPKVSICIPAYKQPEYLRQALLSIFAQTFQDFEVVITDDSPDDSVERIAAEHSDLGRLKYQRNLSPKGSPENWNEAIRLASGEYIKLLHDDDCFVDENCLATFVALLADHPEANFAFCSTLVCDENLSTIYLHSPSTRMIRTLYREPKDLFLANLIGGPSATIHRKRISQRYDPRMKWLVDIDFYIRVLSENRNLAFSNRPLVRTRMTPSSVTSSSVDNRQVELFEFLYLYKKISSGDQLDIRYYARLWWILSKYGVGSRNDLDDLGVNLDGLPAIDNLIFLQHIFQKTGLQTLFIKALPTVRHRYRAWRNFRNPHSAK